jgi:hypothetical protein
MKTLQIIIATLLLVCHAGLQTGQGGEVYIPDAKEKAVWNKLIEQGVNEIVFVKRYSGRIPTTGRNTMSRQLSVPIRRFRINNIFIAMNKLYLIS